MKITARFLVLLAGTGLLGLTAAPAAGDTATDPPPVPYTCKAETQATAADTSVTLTLSDAPAEVHAGDLLSLQGTLTVMLPEAATAASRMQLASKIGLLSTDFGIAVRVGERTTLLKATDAFGEPQSLGSTTRVKASLMFPELKIPSSARGSVVITMPSSATSDPQVTGAPEHVVFGAVLKQDSPLITKRKLDCWLPEDTTAPVIATIPVTKPEPVADPGSVQAPVPAGPAAGDQSAGDAAPTAADAVAPTEPDPGATSVVSDEPPAGPASAPTVSPASRSETESALTEVSASAPPRTVSRGTFIPGWGLVLMASVLPLTALAYAARQRHRLLRLVTSRRRPLLRPQS